MNAFEVGKGGSCFHSRGFRKVSQDDCGRLIEKVAQSLPLCPHPLHWHALHCPLRGRVYFLTFWIWAGFKTCFGQMNETEGTVLSLNLKRLALSHPTFCSSASSEGTSWGWYVRKMWGRWKMRAVEKNLEVLLDQLTASQPPKRKPHHSQQSTKPTTADPRHVREPSQARGATQLTCRPVRTHGCCWKLPASGEPVTQHCWCRRQAKARQRGARGFRSGLYVCTQWCQNRNTTVGILSSCFSF